MTISLLPLGTQVCTFTLVLASALGATVPVARASESTPVPPQHSAAVYVESFEPKDASRDIRVDVLNLEYERRIAYAPLRRIGVGGIVSGYSARGTSYDLSKLFTAPDAGVYPVETTGWGVQGVLRLYLVDEPKVRIFIEGAAGIAFFGDRFPPQGTQLNFTRRHGVGAALQVYADVEIIGGYRVAHISNGGGEGAVDNPAWDGQGPYLGIRYRF